CRNGRFDRSRAPRGDSTGRARRSRTSPIANQGDVHREKHSNLARREHSSAAGGGGRRRPGCHSQGVKGDAAMSLKRKDLLSLAPLSADEIKLILETADSFKEVNGREIKKVPALRGRTVVNLFFEPSTRTRTSFELAAKRLSADVINFSPSSSSVVKGETLLDTARNIEAMQADIIVLRHSSAGAAETLARG